MASSTLKYIKVSTKDGLKRAVRHCKKTGLTALDFETTSLAPEDGRVRLVSLCNAKCHYLVDFAGMRGGFRAVAKLFEGGRWICFHSMFEDRWFMDAGTDVHCLDVGHLRRAILGGGGFSLKSIVLWDLGIVMDKEEQLSDWSAKQLTQSQLDYAYLDADLTWQLWEYWSRQADEGRWKAFHLLNGMVPAVIEMEESGMLLDQKRHAVLVAEWAATKADKIRALRKMVGDDEVANLNSDGQWSDYFALNMPDEFLAAWPRTEKTGQLSMTGETLNMIAGACPGTPLSAFLDELTGYKKVNKYLSSFGETLITKSQMSADKRLHARFHIAAAKTGRFSCSGPNLQQIPRDNDLLGKATSVRLSFRAPLGRRLVSLDYSGIELRVLALLAGDEQLLEDMVHGDVHSEVATVMTGTPVTKSNNKKARQAAKGVSFAIIYGSGATGLAATMRCTLGDAQEYIDFWEQRYPKAFALRYDMVDEAMRTGYIRCADGGTIYMSKKPELPRCANYPVQRAALSIMARAIIRHKNSLDEQRRAGKQRLTRMISTIHDALIDEAATTDTMRCLAIMRTDMTLGYTDVFPGAPLDNLVEGGAGPNWAELG
jgi:DNA polymerase-1